MSVQWKVALVEDDRRLARALSAGLRRDGYRVRHVGSAAEGLAVVHEWNPDLVLLDLMLPDNEGPEIFSRFRAETSAALVGITARAMLSDVVGGLKNGADDYVVKPFALEELSARVAAVLRRLRGDGTERLEVGDLVIEVDRGVASRGRRQLELTATEFRILVLLCRKAGSIVGHAAIAGEVWPADSRPDPNTIEVHIGRLRRKLENEGEPRILHTVHGMGYQLKLGGRR